MCTKRQVGYMEQRHYFEGILREEFIKKGGVIKRNAPHYMVIGECPWLATWFENAAYIKIPMEEFDLKTISFTYEEILEVIDKYGYPQEWNADGVFGPERYIEAHIWSDEVIRRYI